MASGSVQPFQPSGPANTVAVAASTASASGNLLPSVAPNGQAGIMPNGDDAVLIYNSTAAIAFVRIDGPGGAATTNDVPVPAGGRMLMQISPYAAVVYVILSTGSGTVYFTRGRGTTY
jgi:hypothetical protein